MEAAIFAGAYLAVGLFTLWVCLVLDDSPKLRADVGFFPLFVAIWPLVWVLAIPAIVFDLTVSLAKSTREFLKRRRGKVERERLSDG